MWSLHRIAPQILGGSPGSGPCSSSSRSLITLGGGKNTVSRFFTLPFPLSFCANGFQHSEQMSYSLPSISFCRQSFATPQRSQIIMDFPRKLDATVLCSSPPTTLSPTFYEVQPLRA